MPYINNSKDLRQAIRNGPYAWPGGYPIYFLTSDGVALSFKTVKAEYKRISYAVRHREHDGWCVIGYDVNYESLLYDGHTGEQIESAYDVITED